MIKLPRVQPRISRRTRDLSKIRMSYCTSATPTELYSSWTNSAAVVTQCHVPGLSRSESLASTTSTQGWPVYCTVCVAELDIKMLELRDIESTLTWVTSLNLLTLRSQDSDVYRR